MTRSFRAAVATAMLLLVWAMTPLTAFAAYENTHKNTGHQAADLVAVAKTQLGYAEGANDYTKYGEAYGMAKAPWCGFFVSWCARQAGIPKAVLPDSGSAGAFASVGVRHARTSGYLPTVGDLILYGSFSDVDHVGIVERYDPATGRVYVLDGNWSDKVSSHYTTLSDSEVAGFVTPHYTSALTEMAVFNMVVPQVIPQGGVFSISGFVASPNRLTSVNITVADETGTPRLSESAIPDGTTYELSALDAAMRFNELPKGTYSYIVTASDTTKTRRWSYLFEVTGDIDFALRDEVLPSEVAEGGFFCVFGTVTCSEALKTVAIEVYDQAGTFRTGGTLSASGTDFDLHRLDDYLAFNVLPKGTYTLKITAVSTNSRRVWSREMTVGTVMTPVFVFRDLQIPETVAAGTPLAPTGTVTSSHRVTALAATLTDSNGKKVASASLSPSSTTATLDGLTLNTAGIPAGVYTLSLTAGGAYGERTVTFPVAVEGESEQPTVTFTLTGETIPSALPVGGIFSVYGTVAASEPLSRVTIVVTDPNGKEHIRVTAAPQALSYDLHRLDNDVTFNTLKEGHYIYSIHAVTATASTQWDHAFKVGDPAPLETAGDLNSDGDVNTNDVLLLFEVVSGQHTGDTPSSAVADTDGDGDVNTNDVLALFRLVAGL